MREASDIKKKKGLKLLSKMLLAVTIPLIALVVFAGLALEAVGSKTAAGCTETELQTAVYAIEHELNMLAAGEFSAPMNLSPGFNTAKNTAALACAPE